MTGGLPRRSRGAAAQSSTDTDKGTRKALSAVREITSGVQQGEMVTLTWVGIPLSWTGKPTSAIPARVANYLFDSHYRSLCRGLHERRSPQRRRSPPHRIPHRTSPLRNHPLARRPQMTLFAALCTQDRRYTREAS